MSNAFGGGNLFGDASATTSGGLFGDAPAGGFSFANVGAPPETTNETEEDGDAAETLEEECGATFEPLVQLSLQQVCSGEDDEDVLFKMRAKLFRFGKDVGGDACWKERGKGELKLLKNKENGKVRVLLRVDKTRKIRLNHFVYPEYELQPNPTNDQAWVYAAVDFSDEKPEESKFNLKFGSVETVSYTHLTLPTKRIV
eukprot:TRINITY_DN435_c0_g1_i5.p1 TRINITY_DN435_c0_g1~~TRINITY_DN435_c0_g1_i5.p1  ORF type:complete len:199 (-),score=58.50 TRINITY_DN435_c0_g1_i5:159-755(-)